MPIPLDTSVEAEYEDGFILSETELGDVSPYSEGHNTLHAILEKAPEAEHGKLVRFSCFYRGDRHDVDWVGLPDNARPIRFRDGSMSMNMGTGEQTFAWVGCRFGYQFTNQLGKNVQEVTEL